MSSVAEVFAAVTAGDNQALDSLIERDPSLVHARNDQGDSLLLAAAYAGRPDLGEILVRRGAHVGLFEATALGMTERVASLLDEDTTLVHAYSHDGWTPLHLAAFFGRRDIASLLIDRGADTNARSRSQRFAKNNTPLHAAAANRQTPVAELLIAQGADVNARDGSGFTPLDLAANNGNDVLMILLLERGASTA